MYLRYYDYVMVGGVNITVPLRFGGANVSYRLALDVSSLQTVCCHDCGAKLSVRWPRGDKVVAGESRHMQYRSVTYSGKNII